METTLILLFSLWRENIGSGTVLSEWRWLCFYKWFDAKTIEFKFDVDKSSIFAAFFLIMIYIRFFRLTE